MSSTALDAAGLDRPYEYLDECPDELLDLVLRMPHLPGSLREIVRGVRHWHDALMAGTLPIECAWPPEPFGDLLHHSLTGTSIARFCRGRKDLTDAVMADVLQLLNQQLAQISGEVGRLVQRLLDDRARELSATSSGARPNPGCAAGSTATADPSRPAARLGEEDDLAAIQGQALIMAIAAARRLDHPILAKWKQLAADCKAVTEVFGDLGDLLTGSGQDFARGVLKHIGWREIQRLHELVKRIPEVKEIIRQLGRLHLEGEDDVAISERVFTPMRRSDVVWRERPDPRVPSEVKGVVRSGDIARMLPMEAAMLGHPSLKMLWHARRAERALLAYRVEGTDWVREVVEGEQLIASAGPAPKPIRGPIVAIVDTSGSMSGPREQAAKALVLEALRTAHAERRECLLFSFGSTNELLEHRLSLDEKGISQLMAFLTCSFGGGTDPGQVLTQVLDRLNDPTWGKADVLMVSDGDWSVSNATVERVIAGKQRGHRFHGVLVGSGPGLSQVCDPVHRFSDWRLLDA